jgi:signal peptidase II
MKEKLIAYFIILLLVIIADQTLKSYFVKRFGLRNVVALKSKRFKIYVTKNTGAFLGLGKKYPFIVFVFSAVLILILLIYCLSSDEPLIMQYSLAALVSAAISNAADRITRKGVIDYLSVKINKRSVVINLADIVIFISAAVYLISDLFYRLY